MDINMDEFVRTESQKIEEERARLSALLSKLALQKCPVTEMLQNQSTMGSWKCKHKLNGENTEYVEGERKCASATVTDRVPSNSLANYTESSGSPACDLHSRSSMATTSNVDKQEHAPICASTLQTPEFGNTFYIGNKTEFETNVENDINQSDDHSFNKTDPLEFIKCAKEWANKKEVNENNINNNFDTQKQEPRRFQRNCKLNQDDMEQWVTDTFYSYFPGFNNELQKRQEYLRDRQRENQQNFLKHQMLNPPPSLKHGTRKSKTISQNQNLNTARSSFSNTSNISHSHGTDKTDLEIIVNNPDYTPPRNGGPPSTRHKLLQDLRHTELSNIVGGDGVTERNRRNAELVTARKKDYQRELMQQIEEKRRTVEELREKDRQEEEVLTRRLQQQLKTIQLEEQLEKEKMRADKLRFDSEQNRLMREHLLAKLEHDTQLLYAKSSSYSNKESHGRTNNESQKSRMPSDMVKADNDNKVYKYFSTSARHEYRRGEPMPAEIELDIEIPPEISANIERECFHLSEKVCPLCDAPLKNYESCCLRCQKKLSLKMKTSSRKSEIDGNETVNSSENNSNKSKNQEKLDDGAKCSDGVGGNCFDERGAPDSKVDCNAIDVGSGEEHCQTFSLVCVKCERLYTMCPSCKAKSDVCRACHRKRNVCMNCRRTLCSFCLDEIATGRDTERHHINDQETFDQQGKHINDSGSERSFHVLEVNYPQLLNHNTSDGPHSPSSPSGKYIHNNLESDTSQPSFSMNTDRKSVFNAGYRPPEEFKEQNAYSVSFEQLPTVVSNKPFSFDANSLPSSHQDVSIERMRKETDNHLSRYLKNYGDLAANSYIRSKSDSRNRSTQTVSESRGRRDVVLNDEHNLSMPLLREMPRMTRKNNSESMIEKDCNSQRKIDNLNRRWEIPAVQRFSISKSSPKVLTQVGAIRKQLQAELLLDEGPF